MPSIKERLRKWLGPKPEPEPERLYSPPERGAPDPEWAAFNVNDVARAAGTAQAGAPAVADARRNPLATPVHVPDGTTGTVRGVDEELLFVAITTTWPMHAWRKIGRDPEPDYSAGDRVRATGEITTSDGAWSVPHNTLGTVQTEYATGDTLEVEVLFHFNKEDWWNTRKRPGGDPSMPHWGHTTTVTGVLVVTAGTSHFKNVKVRDLDRALRRAGFEYIGYVGDHRHYQHPDGRRTQVDIRTDPVDPNVIVGDIATGAQSGLTQADLLRLLGRPVPKGMLVEEPAEATTATGDPILTMSGEEFIMDTPTGYDYREWLTTGDVAALAPDRTTVLLTDAYFDLDPTSRQRALDRGRRTTVTAASVLRITAEQLT